MLRVVLDISVKTVNEVFYDTIQADSLPILIRPNRVYDQNV